jgi:glutathione synthase/RimK-type ligase-like ATP-grasp enzyme
VAWTSEQTEESLANLTGPPCILQELIEADLALRVVTVRGRTFISSIPVSGVDWRSDLENHERFTPETIGQFPSVEQMAQALAGSLKIGYSSQDWLVRDGSPYFLEVNPNGQWAFLDKAYGGTIGKEMTAALLEIGIRSTS